jgi:hypothetical protein
MLGLAAYLDLVHYRRPGGNPLGNPELDTVKQSPLVLPIYSFVHNRGCHGRMLVNRGNATLTPTLRLAITETKKGNRGQVKGRGINMMNEW